MQKRLILELTYSLDETDAVASRILELIDRGVIAMTGDLGAGKTTLTVALAKQLGVVDQVTSPTYAIVNEYADRNDNIIYHMDLYRIKDEEELLEIGIPDILAQDNWCVVEWPDIAVSYLPWKYFSIFISIVNIEERQLQLYLESIA